MKESSNWITMSTIIITYIYSHTLIETVFQLNKRFSYVRGRTEKFTYEITDCMKKRIEFSFLYDLMCI
jgi:hypothetical protein